VNREMHANRIFALSVLFLLSGSIVWGGSREARQDIWLVMLVNLVLFSLIVSFYGLLCKRCPGKDLFVLMRTFLPAGLWRMLSFIYIVYAFLIGAVLLWNFGQFSSRYVLWEIPKHVPIFLLVAVCIYGAKKGIKAVCLYASFVFPFVCLFLAVTMGLSIKSMDFGELLPVCYDPALFLDGAYTMTAFPFGDVVLLFSAYGAVSSHTSAYRNHTGAVVCAYGILLLIMVRNAAVLGAPLLGEIDYATYHAMGIIGLEDFFKRIEVLLTFAVVFCDVAKGCIVLIFACQGIRSLCSFSRSVPMEIPVAFVMAGLSLLIFDNNAQLDRFLELFRYVSLPVQLTGPGLVLAGVFFQKRNVKKQKIRNV